MTTEWKAEHRGTVLSCLVFLASQRAAGQHGLAQHGLAQQQRDHGGATQAGAAPAADDPPAEQQQDRAAQGPPGCHAGRSHDPPAEDPMGAKWRAQVLYLPVAHYKVEAGADARYLSDLIHRMTGASAYLDSSDLVDLGTLFREGGACIWCHDELEELRISSYHATKSPLALWSLVSAQDLSPERSSAGCITALCRISFLLPYISRTLASCAG